MAAAGAIAGPASIASIGFGAASDLMKGEATKSSDDFQAARAERAAEFGKLQATLTDTTMRENLTSTLGNIDAVRAAAGIDPTSPTTAALEGRSTMLSDRQRMAAVGSIRSQAAEDEASAKYLREAGDFAVTQSYFSAGMDVAKGLSGGKKGGGFNFADIFNG